MAKYDAIEKQWGSLVPPSVNESSLGQRILNFLAKHGSKVAQINDDTGVQLTFEEIRRRTIRIAQNLQKKGLKPRQTIGLLAKNCDDLLAVFLASTCMACPIVPFHPFLSADEIASILEKTKPNVLFCDDSRLYLFDKQIATGLEWSMKLFTFDVQSDGAESVTNLLCETGDESNFVPVEIDMKNDLAGIFCPSGTTGPSKGTSMHFLQMTCFVDIMTFALRVKAGVRVGYDHTVYAEPLNFKEGSIFFDLFSIYWTVGIKGIMESVYKGATRVITGESFSARHQLQIIEKYKITNLNLSPIDLVSFPKYEHIDTLDVSSVKSIWTYGHNLPHSLVNDIKKHFPLAKVTSSYGVTEIGAVAYCLMNNVDDDGGLRLVRDCIAKIVDNNGNRYGPNETGEILAKRSYQFQGYFNDAMATKAAMDDEGFFRTGNVGYFNEHGLLFISARKKNLLATFYFDGYFLPQEMEEVLIEMPEIKEVCVVGVTVVQDLYLPAAIVVRQPGSKLSQNDVFNFAAKHFHHRANLRGGVYFVDELPKTHNGKLVREEITELADQRFKSAKMIDPELQSYSSDIEDEFRQLMFK